MARRDVEKHQFIGSLGLVPGRDGDRIAGIDEVEEPRALHHPPALHIETGDDALGEHGGQRARTIRPSSGLEAVA